MPVVVKRTIIEFYLKYNQAEKMSMGCEEPSQTKVTLDSAEARELALDILNSLPGTEDTKVKLLVLQGLYIDAIKEYRAKTGLGLTEAKAYIDKLKEVLLAL